MVPLAPKGESRPELQRVPMIMGKSEQASQMRNFAILAAQTEHTVLLRGETGAGKDHLAEVIHDLGRRGRPFVPVDCGALTESLSETELFGHTLGAFTDARQIKQGLVQIAEGGTLFFNEVANMSRTLQAKFLRVLEKRSFRQVGGTRELPINTHIIAATNANLELAVQRGEFRLDLYHRLNAITLTVPSLWERRKDIPDLCDHFLQQEQQSKDFSPEAMKLMMEYHWPGNLRELKNAVVRAAFLSREGNIEPEHLQPYLLGVGRGNGLSTTTVLTTFEELQRSYLQEVLSQTRGSLVKATKITGLSYRVLQYKIKTFGLQAFVHAERRSSQ